MVVLGWLASRTVPDYQFCCLNQFFQLQRSEKKLQLYFMLYLIHIYQSTSTFIAIHNIQNSDEGWRRAIKESQRLLYSIQYSSCNVQTWVHNNWMLWKQISLCHKEVCMEAYIFQVRSREVMGRSNLGLNTCFYLRINPNHKYS